MYKVESKTLKASQRVFRLQFCRTPLWLQGFWMSERGQKGLMVPTRLLGWNLTKSPFFRHVVYWGGCHVLFWWRERGWRKINWRFVGHFPSLKKLKAKANVSIPNRRKYLPIVQLFCKQATKNMSHNVFGGRAGLLGLGPRLMASVQRIRWS